MPDEPEVRTSARSLPLSRQGPHARAAASGCRCAPGETAALRPRLRHRERSRPLRSRRTAAPAQDQLPDADARRAAGDAPERSSTTPRETLTILRDGKQVARGQLDDAARPAAHRAVHRRLHEVGAARGAQDRARRRPQLLRRGRQVRAHRQSRKRARARARAWAGRSTRCAFAPISISRDCSPGPSSAGSTRRLRSARLGWPSSPARQRCEATNVDPATGARDMAIPAHLQRTWGHQDFGIYAKVVTGGEIATGAPVTVPPALSPPSGSASGNPPARLRSLAAREDSFCVCPRRSWRARLARRSRCARGAPDGAGTRAARAAAGWREPVAPALLSAAPASAGSCGRSCWRSGWRSGLGGLRAWRGRPGRDHDRGRGRGRESRKRS